MQLYEAHLPVSDLAASVGFYRDVLGLKLAFEQLDRGVAFFYVDSREDGMIGLWTPGSLLGGKDGESYRSHFALSVSLDELFAHIARLNAHGIVTTGFHGREAKEPSVIGWMPSAQIYFTDPDGHSLEYITLLDDAPDQSFFGTWSEWQEKTKLRNTNK